MAKDLDSWRRRPTWTTEDQDAFFSRWGRCRSDSTRTQSLRSQAGTLAQNGLRTEAIGLLNRLLENFPDDYFRGLTYVMRAESRQALGETDSAFKDYMTALQLEKSECPNVHTTAWLDLPWLIVEQQKTELYDQAIEILSQGERGQSLTFPVTTYITNAVRAIIASHFGDDDTARQNASEALTACMASSSGLSRHPGVGLVRDALTSSRVHAELIDLAT